MSEAFIGEIRIFAGNFAPAGWAFCDGGLLSISEYDALFALIGTTYGGDGINNFGLPDLRGRSAVHAGTARTGERYDLGSSGGVEQVTLTPGQMPAHTHTPTTAGAAASSSPEGTRWAAQTANAYSGDQPNAQLAGGAVQPVGGSQPHENMPPYLAVSYIISLYGIYPSREG